MGKNATWKQVPGIIFFVMLHQNPFVIAVAKEHILIALCLAVYIMEEIMLCKMDVFPY